MLAGGRSSRMGTPKAALEWHGSTLLRRTVGILARATGGPVVVVRASGQDLPGPAGRHGRGRRPAGGQGPGPGDRSRPRRAARPGGDRVRHLDRPAVPAPGLRQPRAVRPRRAARRRRERTDPDVALPVARGYQQPLAAAYRTGLAELAERLVKEDRLRPAFLFAECAVTRLDDAALLADPVLAARDPDLDSVLNVNTPDDYAGRQAAAGTRGDRPAVRHPDQGGRPSGGPAGSQGGDVGAAADSGRPAVRPARHRRAQRRRDQRRRSSPSTKSADRPRRSPVTPRSRSRPATLSSSCRPVPTAAQWPESRTTSLGVASATGGYCGYGDYSPGVHGS